MSRTVKNFMIHTTESHIDASEDFDLKQMNEFSLESSNDEIGIDESFMSKIDRCLIECQTVSSCEVTEIRD